MNLIQHGPGMVADELMVKARRYNCSFSIWVSEWGVVTMARRSRVWKRGVPPPDCDLVGVFSPKVKAQVVREALEFRLSEIRPNETLEKAA